MTDLPPSIGMTSSKPYVLRAIYEWILDNNLTPHLVVNAEYPDVLVPREYVKDGGIILNIVPRATHAMLMANDHIEFQARFSGISRKLYVPIGAIQAIYARENGRGMTFPEGEEEGTLPPTTSTPAQTASTQDKPKKKFHLKRVK